MLGFVVIFAPALVLAMGALLCLILALGYVLYLQPALDWLTRPGGGFFRRIVFWPVKKAGNAVKRYVREHVASLLWTYVAQGAPAIRILDNFTELTQRLAGTIADDAEATYKALLQLKKVTIPAMLAAKVQPLWNALAALDSRLDITEGRIADSGQLIGAALDKLPWGSPAGFVPGLGAWLNSYVFLWGQVFTQLQPKVNKVWNEYLPDIWKRLDALEAGLSGKIGQRLKALEIQVGKIETVLEGVTVQTMTFLKEIGNPVFFAAAVAVAVKTLAPNLFCRNTTSVTKSICGQSETLIDQLLASTFFLALVLNPREIARLGEDALGLSMGIWNATVGEALDELGLA